MKQHSIILTTNNIFQLIINYKRSNNSPVDISKIVAGLLYTVRKSLCSIYVFPFCIIQAKIFDYC
jgi:hypothetical protein